MSRRWGWAVVALALAGPLAAEEEEDIFADGAFDAAVAEGQASEDKNKLVWLGGVTLSGGANLILPTDREAVASLSQFTGKGFLKATSPTVGSLFVSYTYVHTLWASTDDPALQTNWAAQAYDPDSPNYQLSEAHLSFDLGKTVFLRVGSQLVDWGASAVWSPADFINRRSSDPESAVDTRTGKPGVRVHVPFAGGNLFLFADASGSLTEAGVPRDLAETGTLGFRTDATLAGWNLGLVGNFGKSSDPRLGLTASGAVLGVDLWAETGAVLPLGDRDLTWAASLGGERSFGLDSEWTLRAEGFWNPEGQGAVDLTGTALAEYVPYYWGRAYLYVEFLKKKLLGPSVTGSLSATSNLADQSWIATASLRTSFPGTIPVSAYVQHNGGPVSREFTLATGGPAITLGLRSVLEF